MNAELEAKYSHRIAAGFSMMHKDGTRGMALSPPFITLEKVGDKKRVKKPPYLIAAYCPFCGEKYKEGIDG